VDAYIYIIISTLTFPPEITRVSGYTPIEIKLKERPKLASDAIDRLTANNRPKQCSGSLRIPLRGLSYSTAQVAR
jgi:hypothetical protein